MAPTPRGFPPPIERPIFVVGTGRSGTTLLSSLLSAHSRIAIAPETHFMKRAEAEGGLEGGPPEDFGAFWHRYTGWSRFEDLGVDEGRCLEVIDAVSSRTFRGVLEAVLVAYAERTGKARVGEKSPSHARYLPELFAWFPDAQVVVVRRDPRAVVASKLRSPWNSRHRTPPSLRGGLLVGSRLHQAAAHADVWAGTYEATLPAWEADPRVFTLAYEALVRDPEGELQGVCAFLGEPYEPAMLTDRTGQSVPQGERPDPRLASWRDRHHSKARGPISSASLGKWKRNLSALEVAMVEGRCAGGMRRMGYAPVTPEAGRAAGRLLARAVLVGERAEARLREGLVRSGPTPPPGSEGRHP